MPRRSSGRWRCRPRRSRGSRSARRGLGVRLIAGLFAGVGAGDAGPCRCRRGRRDGRRCCPRRRCWPCGRGRVDEAPAGRRRRRPARVEPGPRRRPDAESRQHPRARPQSAPAGASRWRRCGRRRAQEIVVMSVRRLGADAMDDAESHAADRGGTAGLLPRAGAGRALRAPRAAGHRSGARRLRRHRVDGRSACSASEVYVGESATISGRRTGAAARRSLGTRRHARPARSGSPSSISSGRSDIYHLGPHAPELSARDLDLIHRIWLDAVKDVGPHLHHHDVVRAALTKWLNN